MKKLLLTLFFLGAFTLSPIEVHASGVLGDSTATSLTSGLTGYWPMDGNTTNWLTGITRDLSSSGANGSLINMSTTTSPTQGKIGGALKFNGTNQYVTTNKPLSAYMSASVGTISAWVNPKGVQSGTGCGDGSNSQIVVDSDNSGGAGGYIWLGVDASGACAGGSDGAANFSVSTSYTPNQWMHLVWVHTGGQLYLYKNGVLANTTALPDIGNLSHIVNFDSGYNQAHIFNGSIDEVRMYNRALSAQEVTQLYALGTANVAHSNTVTLSTGLVGYWPLDGNTTSWTTDTTRDMSGNGNTGSLVSMSTTSSPVAGRIGGALKFNGTSNYVNTNLLWSSANSSVTISAWIKTTSASGDVELVGNYAALTPDVELYLHNGIATAFFRDGGNNGNFLSPTNIAVANDGKWHYVSVTLRSTGSNNTAIVYVDGVSGTPSTNANGPMNMASGSNLDIGRVPSGPNYFPGTIDDVRIYNRALSAGEVQQLYTLGTANVAHSNTVTLSTGLVGYWPLDGNTTSWQTDTTRDMSGNGNTGNLISMSTTTSPTQGKIGQALSINGNGYIDVGNASSINFSTNSFTVTTWFKLTSTIGGHLGIIERRNTVPSGPLIRLESSSGNFHCNISDGTNNPDVSVSPINPNQWYFGACVVNKASNTLTGYLNAASASISASGLGSVSNTGDWLLGRGNGFPAMNGTIDDVRIYNRALSQQEIQQLYLLGK